MTTLPSDVRQRALRPGYHESAEDVALDNSSLEETPLGRVLSTMNNFSESLKRSLEKLLEKGKSRMAIETQGNADQGTTRATAPFGIRYAGSFSNPGTGLFSPRETPLGSDQLGSGNIDVSLLDADTLEAVRRDTELISRQGSGYSSDEVTDANSKLRSKSPMEHWHAIKTSVMAPINLFRQNPLFAVEHNSSPAASLGNSGELHSSLPGWRRLLRTRTFEIKATGAAEFAVASTVYTVVDTSTKKAEVTVLRVSGRDDAATVYFRTMDVKHGARAGLDYADTMGELRFEEGQFSRTLEVPILPVRRGYQGVRSFEVVLTGVEGGKLGRQHSTVVTILESDLRLYLRILNSRWFGLLTFLATAFTLLGANLALVLFDPNWDPAITCVTLLVMFIFLVEMWSLGWVKRFNYLFSTFFFMDIVALVGLFFFLPILPRVEWGNWLGEMNFSILAVARAARAARSGSQLGRLVPPIVKAFRLWILRPLWRGLKWCMPKHVALQMTAVEEAREDEDQEFLEEAMASNSQNAVGGAGGETAEEGGAEKAIKGLRELIPNLLPSSSKIGIAVVEFVVGRLVLMMMLLLLVAVVLLSCSQSPLGVHNAALAAAAKIPSNDSGSTAELDFVVHMYAEYVRSQKQRLVYLRISGHVISAEQVKKLTCGQATVHFGLLHSVRPWWLIVAAPSVPSLNGVTLKNGVPLSEPCYLSRSVNASQFRCPHQPKRAVLSPPTDCDTLAVIDNSTKMKSNLMDNLWLTLALVIILGVGAAIVAADVQSMFLSPLVRLFSVLRFLIGNKDPRGRIQRKQAKRERKASEKDFGSGEEPPDSDGPDPAGISKHKKNAGSKKKSKQTKEEDCKGRNERLEKDEGGVEDRAAIGMRPEHVASTQEPTVSKTLILPDVAGPTPDETSVATSHTAAAAGPNLRVRKNIGMGDHKNSRDLNHLAVIQEDDTVARITHPAREHAQRSQVKGSETSQRWWHTLLFWRLSKPRHAPSASAVAKQHPSESPYTVTSEAQTHLSAQNEKEKVPSKKGQLQHGTRKGKGKRLKSKKMVDWEDGGPDADGLKCPGSPPWESVADSSEGKGEEQSLLMAVSERLSRLLSINQKDIRVLERELDKVERAFGWQLLEVRQWARDVIMWNEMAASMGKSVAKAFNDESLTLGELRLKISLLYDAVRLPAWAAKSTELRLAARSVAVAVALVEELLSDLEEAALRLLRMFGLSVEKKETVSVSMLTRCAIAAILRYEILQKLSEPEPEGFAEYKLVQVWALCVGAVRRKAAQHLQQAGAPVPEFFWNLPLLQLWPAVSRIKTHAIYHRLLNAGLKLGRSAALATKKSELQRLARTAMVRSIRTVLEDYQVPVSKVKIGAGAPATISKQTVTLKLADVPAVQRALKAVSHLRLPLRQMWKALLKPLQSVLQDLFRHLNGAGQLSDEIEIDRQQLAALYNAEAVLHSEERVLWLWGRQEVLTAVPLGQVQPQNSPSLADRIKGAAAGELHQGASSSTTMESDGEMDVLTSTPSFQVFGKQGQLAASSSVAAPVGVTLSQIRQMVQHVNEHTHTVAVRENLLASEERWSRVVLAGLRPLDSALEGVVVGTAQEKLASFLAEQEAGGQRAQQGSPLNSKSACHMAAGRGTERASRCCGNSSLLSSQHHDCLRAGGALQMMADELKAALRGEVYRALRRCGLLKALPSRNNYQQQLSLDSELRLGLALALGHPPHYRQLATLLQQSTPEEGLQILAEISPASPLLLEEQSEEHVMQLVERAAASWMASGLMDRGVEVPDKLISLPPQQAAAFAEDLLLAHAHSQALQLGLAVGPASDMSSFSDLVAEVERVAESQVRDVLAACCSAVTPNFCSGPGMPEHRALGVGSLSISWQELLTAEGKQGVTPLESMVEAASAALMHSLEIAQWMVLQGGSGAEEQHLVALLEWMWGSRAAAVRIEEGHVALSQEGLRAALVGAIDEKARSLELDTLQLASQCLTDLHTALDELLVEWAAGQLAEMSLSMPPGTPAGNSGPGGVGKFALDLQWNIQLSAKEALLALQGTLPPDVDSIPQAQLLRLQFEVNLGNIPELRSTFDAMQLLPASDDDGDELRRFIVKSGYPDKWVGLLPQGATLAPLDEVLRAPRASLAVMAVQVVAQLALMGTQRRAPSFFDAVGAMGRGLLSWLHHVADIYQQQEEPREQQHQPTMTSPVSAES